MRKKHMTVLMLAVLMLVCLCMPVAVSARQSTAADKSSVKKSYCTVSFYLPDGKSNTAYRKLQRKVRANALIRLPKVPARKGFENLGWSAWKKSTVCDKAQRERYRVKRSISFYAVQQGTCNLVLHKNDGSVYKTLNVKDSTVRLPSMKNPKGYTFMGWARNSGQSVKPAYKAGQRIRVKKETHLYAVLFDRTSEPDLQADGIAKVDQKKYSRVIFVGDSRTCHMEDVLEREFGKSCTKGASFVCHGGVTLHWLQGKGYRGLMKEVRKARADSSKPVAVVINMGVNDLRHADGTSVNTKKVVARYVKYLKKLAGELSAKNCRLFYMSVNPVNESMTTLRKNNEIERFNSGIKKKLKGIYTYIDTNTYLMNRGYGTNRHAEAAGPDDGTHYTPKTYKRIYDYCMRRLNRY